MSCGRKCGAVSDQYDLKSGSVRWGTDQVHLFDDQQKNTDPNDRDGDDDKLGENVNSNNNNMDIHTQSIELERPGDHDEVVVGSNLTYQLMDDDG